MLLGEIREVNIYSRGRDHHSGYQNIGNVWRISKHVYGWTLKTLKHLHRHGNVTYYGRTTTLKSAINAVHAAHRGNETPATTIYRKPAKIDTTKLYPHQQRVIDAVAVGTQPLNLIFEGIVDQMRFGLREVTETTMLTDGPTVTLDKDEYEATGK